MGLFSFTKKLAIDLGTANTVIIQDGKIIIDQPSYVTMNRKTEKVEWVGSEAYRRFEKENNDLETIRPLRDGVVADLTATEYMIRGMIKMADKKSSIFPSSLKVVVCVPSGSTDVEIRAVRDACEKAGANEVHLIFEPMAAAIGIGLDVMEPAGNMIVDIGGGTTEIAVISLGGIVNNKSIKVAGDELTSDIVEYMKSKHSIRIGERTAEEIKKRVGSALDTLDDEPEDFVIIGQDLANILPKSVSVNYREISKCLDKSIQKIETAVGNAIDNTEPELYADIYNNGVYLTGGGALLKGLGKRLSDKFQIPFIVAEDSLHAVAKGTYEALKNSDKYNLLFK